MIIIGESTIGKDYYMFCFDRSLYSTSYDFWFFVTCNHKIIFKRVLFDEKSWSQNVFETTDSNLKTLVNDAFEFVNNNLEFVKNTLTYQSFLDHYKEKIQRIQEKEQEIEHLKNELQYVYKEMSKLKEKIEKK